jgi:tetratricopeptide (TPR) repeat protein
MLIRHVARAAIAVTLSLTVGAQEAEARVCSPAAGILISAQGQVEVRSDGDWQQLSQGQTLCDRDAIRTGANSRAAIQLVDDAVLRLDQNTTLVLSDIAPEPEERSLLQLVFGAFQSFSRDPQTLEIDTPYINATIEGTEFALRVTDQDSTLTVVEGVVLASNALGSVSVASGAGAIASAGSAPRSVIVARPRDAVVWGLYYPPALSVTGATGAPALDEAMRLAAENRPDSAISMLEAVPDPSTPMRLYQASLLLSVGRVDEAGRILDAVVATEPGNGTALAQSAVIDIVRNDRDTALAKAERAVATEPDVAAPYIALSLAQQSAFRLEEARDTLLTATQRAPDSALVWARLSEIWLTLGYRDRSGEAADRALALDPNLERAHVMKGFAALTEYRTADAREAFERAAVLDPADPLPHLGLGLALIRDGDLKAGRGAIDAAVALDSNRSLFRSYLGKAYFEEGRSPLAAQQFEIAKDLDPQDPTPYLYDAIRLQTETRPGEALAAIQDSIALNDNRAVYRSRLQLDQDQAARGASLGRIYEDLGFIALGMREATGSQGLDPSNAAAHRFLADIYRNERRRELARVSELTRAQLLQDVGLSPVQPSLTETNLNLVSAGGPANAGFNEFNSLFASDGFRFTGSGVLGDDHTFGGEAAFAMQQDNVSVSFGGVEFETEGFRDNFDVEHSIYDLFVQWAVTPEFNIQVEGRHRRTENGDLNFNFGPSDFDPTLRQTSEESSFRIGGRFAPDPHNTSLVSFIYAERQDDEENFAGFGPPPNFPPFFFNTAVDGTALQGEFQHILQSDIFTLTVGGSLSQTDSDFSQFFTAEGFPPFPVRDLNFASSDYRIYGYGTVTLPFHVTLTAGLSYDWFENGPVEVEELNPKAGIEWAPIEDLRVRAAYAQVVKPPLATNRTLEPTQVAGFNQYFDDANGTVSERYGFGVDWQITSKLFLGGEMTWRDLDNPFIDNFGEARFADHDEQTHRVYLNALPHPRVPVSLELVYDKFKAEPSLLSTEPNTSVPLKVETVSAPVTATYFDPSGFFAGVRGTFVRQEVTRAPGNRFASGDDEFFLVDLQAGYRFPNRRGSLTLQVNNLTDQDFRYQDDGFREFGDQPSTGPYFPGISVLGKLTVNF